MTITVRDESQTYIRVYAAEKYRWIPASKLNGAKSLGLVL